MYVLGGFRSCRLAAKVFSTHERNPVFPAPSRAGLPAPTVSWWLPMPDAAKLAPLALVVMVVDLLESTSIARALAAKCKYELNANQVSSTP